MNNKCAAYHYRFASRINTKSILLCNSDGWAYKTDPRSLLVYGFFVDDMILIDQN